MEVCDPLSAARKLALQLWFQIFFRRFCLRSIMVIGVGCFFTGTLILIGRIFGLLFLSQLMVVSLGGVAVVLIVVALAAFFRTPRPSSLLTWLASKTRDGGLLCAASEVELGEWRSQVTLPELPRFQRFPLLLFVPLLIGVPFLIGCWCLPVSPLNLTEEKRNLELTAETTMLAEKIEVLEEESLAPEEELEEVKEAFSELISRNDALEAGRTYELLDALERRLNSLGEQAASDVARRQETLTMLAGVMEAMAAQPDSAVRQRADEELEALMRQLAADYPELAQLFRAAGVEGESKEGTGRRDPKQLRRMANALKKDAQKFKEQLERMAQAQLTRQNSSGGSCSSGESGRGKAAAARQAAEREALERWLNQNAAGAQALRVACEAPGNGGVQRGRGDAELNFSGMTGEFDGPHDEVSLDGDLDSKKSVMLETFAAAPSPDGEVMEAAKSGALAGDEAMIERRSHQLYPEHRKIVEQYFQTPVKTGVEKDQEP